MNETFLHLNQWEKNFISLNLISEIKKLLYLIVNSFPKHIRSIFVSISQTYYIILLSWLMIITILKRLVARNWFGEVNPIDSYSLESKIFSSSLLILCWIYAIISKVFMDILLDNFWLSTFSLENSQLVTCL